MKKCAEYWINARERIAKFKQQDPNCELVFASKSHKYKILDPVSESRLKHFESENGVVIPPEYRSFLANFGAGGPGPDYGIFDFAEIENVDVKTPFHLAESTEWPEEDDDLMWDLPGLVTISTSGCAIDWYLEINGFQPGTMWVNAGPNSQLLRCESFGKWYEYWLDRIEKGLEFYELIRDLVNSNTTLQNIKNQVSVEWYTYNRDGSSFLRFRKVPGRIRFIGEKIIALETGNCWIQ